MHKTYDWLLFDADETLFDYNSYHGLTRLLARYGIAFSREEYAQFQAINQPLWQAYQQGKINMAQLAEQRFTALAQRTGQGAQQLNHELQLEMAQISQPLAGARECLANAHHAGIRIGMITNGFAVLQQPRLQATKLAQYIDLMIISELEGYAKPDKRLFEIALHKMQQPAPERVLMIGDNPDSDIVGGAQVGMDTAWYNPQGKPCPSHIAPTYQIQHLQQLTKILHLQPKQPAP